MKTCLFLGHSHIESLVRAHRQFPGEAAPAVTPVFINFREERFQLRQGGGTGNPVLATSLVAGVDREAVIAALRAVDADAAILYVNGNQHNVFGLFQTSELSAEEKCLRLFRQVRSMLVEWLEFLQPLLPASVKVLLPPPPADSAERIYKYLANQKNQNLPEAHRIEPDGVRLLLWKTQCRAIREVAEEFRLAVIEPPAAVFTPHGLLAAEFWDNDPTHGNAEYGRRVLAAVLGGDAAVPAGRGAAPDRPQEHPYGALPAYCFWKQAVSDVAAENLDPMPAPPFRIGRQDKVATAGSCFAQHISKRLRAGGYRFLVTEPAGGETGGRGHELYDFSARYGNIYTARQLLQLFDRAFGYFRPLERVWTHPGGGFCDPFRPRIEAGGFASEEAVLKDTARHLGAVRRMFRQLDVFVFTLGLTECWVSRLDGAAYPVAPGVAGGSYDPQKHAFANFGVAEVAADLRLFLQKLRLVNPGAKVILTVSPVPLVATAADRHVLVATTYSKAVLRVAAEEVAAGHANVCYFPSYEIITGPHAGGSYFAADRRSVTEQGVDHVMRVFMGAMTAAGGTPPPGGADAALASLEAIVEAACDEELLARP